MRYRYARYAPTRCYKLLTMIFLATTILLAAYVIRPREIEQTLQPVLLPELSTSGFSKVEKVEVGVVGNTGVVSLKTECYELTAFVEPFQAESIQRGIDKTFGPRPNAHDIIKDILHSLKIEVVMVKITQLKENSFYSKMILRQNNIVLNLDARPSDAIAVALRVEAPIYINTTLLEEVGKKIC